MAQANQSVSTQTKQGTARIKSGVNNRVGGMFVGKSIAEIREEFGSDLKIKENSKAMKGKSEVEEDYIVQPNDEINFIRRLGEKGEKG